MSKQKTIKRSIYDPAIASGDTAGSYTPDYRDLSYLAGAVETNDMGYCGGEHLFAAFGPSEPGDSWRTQYERKQRLRRHTVDQGSSTFAFPKDAVRKNTGD